MKHNICLLCNSWWFTSEAPFDGKRSWMNMYGYIWLFVELDESTARRQLKSPRSLSGRSIHLTLVTKWSWSWSWMTYCHPLCAMSIGPPILIYSYFKIWPWKSMIKVMCVVQSQSHVWPSNFKGQGYGQGQTQLRPGIQSICLLLVSWQSEHFWLRYRKFHIWPWKFKVKVMAKVKPDGRIWGLGVQSICLLSFRGNRTIFGWDIANSIFDLEKSRSRSWLRSNPMVFSFRGNRTIFGWDIANSIFDLEKSRSRSCQKSTKIKSSNLQVRTNNRAKNERNPKSCSKVIAWTRICGRRQRRRRQRWRRRRRRTNRYKNIKSPPVYRGDLIKRMK